ncbi:MAG TPA: hypothetical protein VM285_11560, partial [Polyangia bacterium]|nr:hypothetical protein [Polyangia bacterium]
MTRFLAAVLLLVCATRVVGSQARVQDGDGEATAAERPGGPGRLLGELEHLEEVELPGEGLVPPPAGPGGGRGGLAGRVIVGVVAHEPPAGFDPVADAELAPGTTLGPGVVRRVVERLWATDRYRDIKVWARPRPDGAVDLLIGVEPLLRITRLEVSGNKALDAGEVNRAVEYTPHRTILAEPAALLDLKQRLLTAYALCGYPRAEAVLRLETTGEPGEVVLAVEVSEGLPDRWDRIDIEGLPAEVIAARLGREIGLRDGTIRDRSLLERGVDRLPERLSALGYLDARIGKPVERQLEGGSFALAIPVTPGIRTRVLFAGNRRLRTRELEGLLTDGFALKTTPSGVAAAVERLERHHRRQGLFHARAWAWRICRDGDRADPARKAAEECSAGTADQDLLFFVREGPPVELTQVVFEGNSYLDDERLDRELRAFLGERNERSELFQPIQTSTVDDLGLSDHRPGRSGRSRGALAPVTPPERIYVPEEFSAAMEHLAGLYREQGFLDVGVSDRCRVAERPEVRRFGTVFRPLVLAEEADGGPTPGGETPCVLIDESLDGLLAVVRIEEGPRTLLDEIEFEGNDILASRQLLDVSGLAAEQPYNEFRLHEARRDI